MQNHIKGNLITLAKTGHFDVIVHGCNCFNKMGAGIAKQIKTEFPQAWVVDQQTVPGDRQKLGNFTEAEYSSISMGTVSIINAYTQYSYGSGMQFADYDAIRSVFRQLATKFKSKHIAYPLIGAGLAGGDWNVINEIINQELSNEYHSLVTLK